MTKPIRVGNAPCSWGTLEFAQDQAQRIDCDTMLDELVATGYKGSELGDWGFMPNDPSEVVEKFAKRRLSLTGAFVPVALRDKNAHAEGLAQCLRTAQLLHGVSEILNDGIEPFLVLADDNGTDPIRTQNAGRVQPSMMLTASEWTVFATGVNMIAQRVREETGLRTVFHHHCAGFVETTEEIDILLDSTESEYVGLVFDTGHYAFGQGTCDGVVDALERYANRIWYAHFKDFQPTVYAEAVERNWDYFGALEHGVFCELGDGCVDFPVVLGWLRARDYRGFVTVEQDILPGMGAPKASAQRDRDYLRSIGL